MSLAFALLTAMTWNTATAQQQPEPKPSWAWMDATIEVELAERAGSRDAHFFGKVTTRETTETAWIPLFDETTPVASVAVDGRQAALRRRAGRLEIRVPAGGEHEISATAWAAMELDDDCPTGHCDWTLALPDPATPTLLALLRHEVPFVLRGDTHRQARPSADREGTFELQVALGGDDRQSIAWHRIEEVPGLAGRVISISQTVGGHTGGGARVETRIVAEATSSDRDFSLVWDPAPPKGYRVVTSSGTVTMPSGGAKKWSWHAVSADRRSTMSVSWNLLAGEAIVPALTVDGVALPSAIELRSTASTAVTPTGDWTGVKRLSIDSYERPEDTGPLSVAVRQLRAGTEDIRIVRVEHHTVVGEAGGTVTRSRWAIDCRPGAVVRWALPPQSVAWYARFEGELVEAYLYDGLLQTVLPDIEGIATLELVWQRDLPTAKDVVWAEWVFAPAAIVGAPVSELSWTIDGPVDWERDDVTTTGSMSAFTSEVPSGDQPRHRMLAAKTGWLGADERPTVVVRVVDSRVATVSRWLQHLAALGFALALGSLLVIGVRRSSLPQRWMPPEDEDTEQDTSVGRPLAWVGLAGVCLVVFTASWVVAVFGGWSVLAAGFAGGTIAGALGGARAASWLMSFAQYLYREVDDDEEDDDEEVDESSEDPRLTDRAVRWLLEDDESLDE